MDDDYMNNFAHSFDEGRQRPDTSDIKAPPSLLPRLMQRLQVPQQDKQTLYDIASFQVALNNTDEFVRATAIRKLAQWRGNIADIPVERLLAALSDSSWLVREATIITLDALQIEVSQEHQMMALLDESEFVRETARLAFASHHFERGMTFRARTSLAPTIRRGVRSHMYHALRSIDSLFLAVHLTNQRGLFMAGQYPRDNNDVTYLEEIILQQRKRRRTTFGIMGGILAVLVVVGIAFSWFTVLQKMPHNATGHAGITLDTPLISDTNELNNPQLNWINSTHLALSDPYNLAYATLWNVATKTSEQANFFNSLTTQQFQNGDASWTTDGRYIVIRVVSPDTPPTTSTTPTSDTVTVEVWNALSIQKLLTVSYHEKEIVTQVTVNPNNIPYPPPANVSPDNTRLAVGQNDGSVTVWSLSTGMQVASYRIDSSYISTVQWSNNSQRLLAQSSSGLVQLWNVETGEKISSFLPPLTKQTTYTSSGQTSKNVPTTPTLSPDGKRMVGVVGSDKVEVWDANTTKVLYIKQVSNSLLSAGWLSDKGILINITNNLQIWNLDTNQIILNVPGVSQQASWAFSPSQRYFSVIGPSSQNTAIWDATTGQQVTVLHSKADFQINGFSQSIVWSPDERYVATLSKDALHTSLNDVIQIWNATTGKLVTQYHSHGTQVLQVTWSPDSKYLASVSDGNLGNVMEVWQAPR